MNELNEEIKEELNDLNNKVIENCDKMVGYIDKRNDKLMLYFDECSNAINDYLKNSKIKMELKDTIELMISSDYNGRFTAEIYQLLIRIDKLQTMLEKYKNNQLDFTPKCSYELLSRQLEAMIQYRDCLLEREIIEDINIYS